MTLPQVKEKFLFRSVKEEEILTELKNLKRKKATGLDNLPPGFHLEFNGFLSEHQFGFRPNRSTELAVTLFTDLIRKEADRGKATGAIFIDLSKAFDTISHSVLLEKLSGYGIQDNELN